MLSNVNRRRHGRVAGSPIGSNPRLLRICDIELFALICAMRSFRTAIFIVRSCLTESHVLPAKFVRPGDSRTHPDHRHDSAPPSSDRELERLNTAILRKNHSRSSAVCPHRFSRASNRARALSSPTRGAWREPSMVIGEVPRGIPSTITERRRVRIDPRLPSVSRARSNVRHAAACHDNALRLTRAVPLRNSSPWQPRRSIEGVVRPQAAHL